MQYKVVKYFNLNKTSVLMSTFLLGLTITCVIGIYQDISANPIFFILRSNFLQSRRFMNGTFACLLTHDLILRAFFGGSSLFVHEDKILGMDICDDSVCFAKLKSPFDFISFFQHNVRSFCNLIVT